ncbi:hypothetical protein BKA70DRAFT_535092 [Coprinopsis sp. MPI-PUGE-AT-0042]|nr:hypothetical protein BKA70DRAFT_535092 [Coprinopsis sp. MPI-PUGE-AT-0042]
MARRTTHNVQQESSAIGRELSSRIEDAPRTNPMFHGAHDLQFANSTFSVVGRDAVSNYNHHFHYDRPKDIWAVLQSIPNFRRIYQDMLSKATPGTGVWLLKGDKFRLWLEPNGDIKIFWGSGIRKSSRHAR